MGEPLNPAGASGLADPSRCNRQSGGIRSSARSGARRRDRSCSSPYRAHRRACRSKRSTGVSPHRPKRRPHGWTPVQMRRLSGTGVINLLIMQLTSSVHRHMSWWVGPTFSASSSFLSAQTADEPVRGTRINSSDPPLTAARTAYAPPPFLPFFHPPIELNACRPRGRLHLDHWIDFSAICFGTPLHIGVARIHT